MTITADDLGVLGSLATSVGILEADGSPNPDWFGNPAESLSTVLAHDGQREALIAFVDEAMGGADRETDLAGATWLPIVRLTDPDLTVAVTVDDTPATHVLVGLGVSFSTESPASSSSVSVPLFRAPKDVPQGQPPPSPFVLGGPDGRIRFETLITVDSEPPAPGEARLGAIGLEADVPTSSDGDPPAFGLVLEGLLLPGASTPETLSVSVASADELDDVVLDLVLSLVRAQAEAAGGTALGALAGLLGVADDGVPDFPVEQLAIDGVGALGVWLEEIVATTVGRQEWLDHLATLLDGTRIGDEVALTLGALNASLRLSVRAEPGPAGHVVLTASVAADVGAADQRVQVQADAVRIDLGTGEAVALPALGIWASIGRHDGVGTPVLDVADPTVARADTLRLGFGLGAERRLTFVLAADGVRLGTRDYATLDLTTPDAVMDAVGNAVEDVAAELLANLGSAAEAVEVLLGLEAPAGEEGLPTIGLADLLLDPLGAVGGYWRALLADHADAVPAVFEVLRDTVADASAAVAAIGGSGSALDPWRIRLIGPFDLEAHSEDDTLVVALAAGTSVDSLGQRCTVIETRLAATVAVVDFASSSTQLLPSVEAALVARERGVSPSRVRLVLADDVEITAEHVGLRVSWAAVSGLAAQLEAPSLSLDVQGEVLPIEFPVVGEDGSVTLPAESWDAIQALVGELGALFPGVVGDVVELLGWSGPGGARPGLRLADLVEDPAAAFAAWLPEFLLSDLGPYALGLLADLLTAAGPVGGALAGTGHPDDPYRLALEVAPGVPELVVWFPPAGLEPRLVGAPEAVRSWRPGDPALSADALAGAVSAEAAVSTELRDLATGRDIVGGLGALLDRWVGGDGRTVPPVTAPEGVEIERYGVAAGQLLDLLDLDDLLGRLPATVVYVDIGAASWPAAPADRRVDLTAAGLTPEMFAAPAAGAGEWFVALGERAACRLATGDDDGTVGQAARLGRVLDALAPLGDDLVVVGVGGAGHAARLAAQDQNAVSDVITVGTPLGPVSLTALDTQPTADALRLLHRLVPEPIADVPDDEDLALGRYLVTAMMELADRPDPGSELRPPATALPAPRAGLTTNALFGAVDADRVGRAITAVVVAGLATRARARAETPLPEPTGVRFGVRLVLPTTTSGSLVIEGDALATLAGYDREGGLVTERELRVRLMVRDRLGWLASTPDHALRVVTADVLVPLAGGDGAGQTTITLHDARAFGTDDERLVLTTADVAPLSAEARLLLGVAVECLLADTANEVAAGLAVLLEHLGLVAAGGAVPSAFEQLVHDPAGLVADRLAAAGPSIAASLAELLGPAGSAVDLDTGTLTLSGGSPTSGLFGWSGELAAAPDGLTGEFRVGSDAPAGAAGALQLVVDVEPFAATLHWRHPSGGIDEIAVWPSPNGGVVAAALAQAAPSLGAHVSLELMRRADEEARPVIDAVLDALGMLGGDPGDDLRPLRPLAGFLADPAGWLRSADSVAAQPVKAQALLDALRPLTGLGGGPGEPLAIAAGVTLSVAAEGADLRLELAVQTSGWAAVPTPAGRLAGGVVAGLTVSAAGPARTSLAMHAGLTDAAPGRNAVHVVLGTSRIEVFLRPASGADVPLLPFAGLGSLAAAAELALPFLLDQLAAIPGAVGEVVGGVGDALALRSGTPAGFDGDALTAWAADPVSALTTAVPSIIETGLTTLAPLVDAVVPPGVAVTGTATELTVTAGTVALGWNPSAVRVTVGGPGIDVPGIEELSFTVAIDDAGLDELSLTVGPAAIDAESLELRPFATVAAGGAPAGGRRVTVGLALDDTHRFAARWLLDAGEFALVASDGAIDAPVEVTDPEAVALRAVEAVADLAAAVALGTDAVQELLDVPVGADQVRDLLRGVVLEDVVSPNELIEGLFEPTTVLPRVRRLFENVAGAELSLSLDGLELTLLEDPATDVIGLQVGLTERWELLSDDITLWLENDDSWIEENADGEGGLFLGLARANGSFEFEPSLTVNGVGLRIGKTSGPLLDFGITLESIALHTFAALGPGVATGWGLQVAFANLAVAASSASGGNSIAAGLLANSGPQPPKPAFSPALAIQRHGNEPVHVTLRAGEGDGPWWIAIRQGFGPLYLEQIGLSVEMPELEVERISLLMDGSVSIVGLTCAVDDLQITYFVSRGDLFDPANWEVDLAGLAVAADLAGVTISGGLLKSGTAPNIEYLGMLLGRFGVYGITIYGGYGEGESGGERFTAFFAVGAVVGPIGGPPAFFVTGIGGGFGINRALVVPTDLSKLGDYPLIEALDVSASSGDPMDELRSLGAYFPMEPGTFWFAAGLSFNSFALVDGIAVVAVEIGDGLDVSLLGLASMALPRPEVAIVSIELALVARFSSSEGILWVQGQLTDNSWLLYPDVRLTGGFAYVTWFTGDYRGQFVLTIGGYHPDFVKPGYPQVPRLGLTWAIGSSIVVEAGGYFALTSEAVMAGGDFEVSAEFGAAWAEVTFGAHGIVYFDPFRYQVEAYARVAAGVTVDTWLFGEITISVSLGCSIEVEGPDFHGEATFEVGPVELTVEFGSPTQTRKELLTAEAFIAKYLAEATPGHAEAITAIVSSGAQPSGGSIPTPDGSAARPFVVVCEFGLVLTSIVPATDLSWGLLPGESGHFTPSRQLGVAPMGTGSIAPEITLLWERAGVPLQLPFAVAGRPYGAFPLGVWGPPQDDDNRKTPAGDIVEALNELALTASAVESPGGPEIPYYQVEIGPRMPLPFTRRGADATRIRNRGSALAALVPEPASVDAAFVTAGRWIADSASPVGLATLRGERQAPPRFGTLGEGLDAFARSEVPSIGERPEKPLVDTFVYAPVAVGVLSKAGIASAVEPARGTTVKGSGRLWRTSPPTLASVELARSRSIAAQLVAVESAAAKSGVTRTLVAAGDVPTTAVARAAPTAVAMRGGEGRGRLVGLTTSLAAGRRVAAAAATPGAALAAGEVAVLRLPNAARDVGDGERPQLGVRGGAARLVAVATGGEVVADEDVGGAGGESAWAVPPGTERIAVVALGDRAEQESGLAGWHAATQLPYVGWSTALGARCTVRTAGEPIVRHRERGDAGWVSGAELARGLSTVATRFSLDVTTVLVVLDDPEALGGAVDGRRLVLGLDGASRAVDASGAELPPVVLVSENRSVLAYDVVPAGEGRPVVVTVASEQGWSLAGVLSAAGVTAESAIAAIAARGLDGSLRPLVPGRGGGARLVWLGEKPPGAKSRKRAGR